MLTVVTWLWGDGRTFGPEYVNRLARSFKRNYHAPHDFVCVTDWDDLQDFDSSCVRTFPMMYEHAEMRSGNRSCFRRLRLHDEQTGRLLGDRILQLDLDTVIVGDVTNLFARDEPLVLTTQNASAGRTTYNP